MWGILDVLIVVVGPIPRVHLITKWVAGDDKRRGDKE